MRRLSPPSGASNSDRSGGKSKYEGEEEALLHRQVSKRYLCNSQVSWSVVWSYSARTHNPWIWALSSQTVAGQHRLCVMLKEPAPFFLGLAFEPIDSAVLHRSYVHILCISLLLACVARMYFVSKYIAPKICAQCCDLSHAYTFIVC